MGGDATKRNLTNSLSGKKIMILVSHDYRHYRRYNYQKAEEIVSMVIVQERKTEVSWKT